MKKLGILLACAVVVSGISGDAWAAKRHHRGTSFSSGAEPQGAERERQFKLATKACQVKYGSAYTGIHAQWMRTQGTHGWFCTYQ